MRLMTRNMTAHWACGPERSINASPNNTNSTPDIIGLRTYRYGPRTTRWRGGSQGASVPFPSLANRRIDETKSNSPSTSRPSPTICAIRCGVVVPSASCTPFVRAIQKGISTATTNGSEAIASTCRIRISTGSGHLTAAQGRRTFLRVEFVQRA